jgi:hypothetical protein
MNRKSKYSSVHGSVRNVRKTSLFWRKFLCLQNLRFLDFHCQTKQNSQLCLIHCLQISSTNQNPYIAYALEFWDNGSMSLIGYARVSTQDQHLHLQQDALKSAGCLKIFTDTISGATTERKGLDEALDYVRSGDTLVVWRLDRLGRSLKHLIETVTMLQEKGIGFKSLVVSSDDLIPLSELRSSELTLIICGCIGA